MGALADAVSEQPNFTNKTKVIKMAMDQLDDGSWEELCEVLRDGSVSSAVVATAITKATKVRVSGRTIADWRKNEDKMANEFSIK